MTLDRPRRNCPPVWFQDEYYSPDGHWIECEDERVHLTSIVEWIGNTPIAHGERETEKGPYEYPCLCGHPDYLLCPAVLCGQDILNLTISPRASS